MLEALGIAFFFLGEGALIFALIRLSESLEILNTPNLVPRALFPGFGGAQSKGKAPWGRGWNTHPGQVEIDLLKFLSFRILSKYAARGKRQE